MEISIIFCFVAVVIILLWVIYRQIFKIAYYEQRLINNDIQDTIKDMPWYKLWLD